VLVAGEDHLSSPFVEGLPQRLYVVGVAVLFPGAEARMMHVGQRAPLVLGVTPPSVRMKPLAKAGDTFDAQPTVGYFLKPGSTDLYLLASEQFPAHGLVEAPRRVVTG
jgi:hypothetical protein